MNSYKKIAKLSPAISSYNLGDYIIDDYCNDILRELFGNAFFVNIPTHEHLSELGCTHIASADHSIVCGTNLLTSHMQKYRQWNINYKDAMRLWLIDVPKKKYLDKDFLMSHYKKNKVLLLGAGWWQYQDRPDHYTQKILKMILSENGIHSVRDSYTEKMLKSIGITNVVNTGCPTMWRLTESYCKRIPKEKSENVVTTLTHYNVNNRYDQMMIEILLQNYRNVYIWLQAIEDYDLIRNSKYFGKVKIIAPTLKSYDDFLDSTQTDYVGTRLHGGIRALNKKHRAIIIGVDNRAAEISSDTNLPVIKREEIDSKLDSKINEKFATEIHLPIANIDKWKAQFKE